MRYVKPLRLYREVNLFREILNTHNGRLMGVSVRDNRIRFSVSDDVNKIATPSRILAKNRILGQVEELQALRSLICTHSISGFVIGYPFQRELVSPTAGRQTKRFVNDLRKTGKFEDMDYTYWDDALKSMDSEHKLMKCNLDSRSLSEAVDECSACDILQGYMDFLIRNQDRITFVGEHGHVDFSNPNPE